MTSPGDAALQAAAAHLQAIIDDAQVIIALKDNLHAAACTLESAALNAAAAERERIAQLADEQAYHSFADLLRALSATTQGDTQP